MGLLRESVRARFFGEAITLASSPSWAAGVPSLAVFCLGLGLDSFLGGMARQNK